VESLPRSERAGQAAEVVEEPLSPPELDEELVDDDPSDPDADDELESLLDESDEPEPSLLAALDDRLFDDDPWLSVL
jgi:hypothetical protein